MIWLGYGCDHKELHGVEPREGVGWSPLLALTSAVALVGAAAAAGMSLHGYQSATRLFWMSYALIVVPAAVRLAWPRVSRVERVLLLNLLGVALYMTRILANPTAFYSQDELLHLYTTIDII